MDPLSQYRTRKSEYVLLIPEPRDVRPSAAHFALSLRYGVNELCCSGLLVFPWFTCASHATTLATTRFLMLPRTTADCGAFRRPKTRCAPAHRCRKYDLCRAVEKALQNIAPYFRREQVHRRKGRWTYYMSYCHITFDELCSKCKVKSGLFLAENSSFTDTSIYSSFVAKTNPRAGCGIRESESAWRVAVSTRVNVLQFICEWWALRPQIQILNYV
jgi:hypothetical protein